MKKMMIWVMAATLICGASVFTSCTNDTSDNPVPAPGKNSITVKEGGEVTPKVTVSPTSATEGETVTLTAVNGYKFRRVEVDNASVTAQKDGKLLINYSLLTVPFSWGQEVDTYLTVDELPGFKPITAEEAAQWVASESDKEEGAYFIYDFDAEGNMLYYGTLFGGDPIAAEPGKMPHSNMSYLSNSTNLHLRFYYTSSATVIGDKTEATFQMPAGAANVDVDMVRDMRVDVTATMGATEFSLKKEGDNFVLTEGEGLTAILPDVYDEMGAPLVEMQESIDYKLQLQKQDKYTERWDDVRTLSEGTFRWTVFGIGSYDGIINSAPFTLAVEPDLNLAETIIGKWIETEVEGRPALTNEKAVTTFVSATKALFSSSLPDYTEKQAKWSDRREYAVKITGNKVSLTGHPESDPTITLIEDFFISSVTATEIVCRHRHTTIRGGQGDVSFNERNVRLTKADIDYRQDVIGTWEGKNSEGWNERWQIKADGTYVYSRKVGDGDWELMVDIFNQYVVDGYMFYARWKNDTEGEQRQWWEIESIQNGVMKWKSLRQNADGTTSIATVEMERVE